MQRASLLINLPKRGVEQATRYSKNRVYKNIICLFSLKRAKNAQNQKYIEEFLSMLTVID
jgi:hypothetical protein